jgi:hypothetical protein
MILSLSLIAWGCAPTSVTVAASDTRTASPTSAPDSQLFTITRSGAQPSRKGPAECFAIQEHLDGKVVEWMEKVSDEQYGG